MPFHGDGNGVLAIFLIIVDYRANSSFCFRTKEFFSQLMILCGTTQNLYEGTITFLTRKVRIVIFGTI